MSDKERREREGGLREGGHDEGVPRAAAGGRMKPELAMESVGE